ncbi:MAG: shikimate kinase [Nitrospirae bacterium]|jgi:shikimate kinase|nr:shikimate kinase [Nitrospirota bacterium]
MKNIILTGFMGTGKTAVAKELSSLLNLKMVDIDNEIEKAEGITINEIFERYGESKFRDIETEMIKKISPEKNLIISTGGGVVLREENIRMLKENGIIICLIASPETIFERTKNNSDRPLLKVSDPLKKIKELLEFRMPFYKKADIIINTEGKAPLQIAEEIIEKIKWI